MTMSSPPAVAPRRRLRDFERFSAELVTEAGAPFRLEPWQRMVLVDIFGGTRETVCLLPKKNGKCLDPATPVTLADGSRRRADAIAVGDRVLAWGDGRLVSQPVRAVEMFMGSRMVDVRTRAGRCLRATADHPVLVRGDHRPPSLQAAPNADRWVPAGDLRPGDRLVPALGDAGPGSSGLSRTDAYLLGAWCGDGGAGSRFSSGTPEVVGAFAENYSVRHVAAYDYEVRGVRPFLREHGLFGCRAREKRVPPAVFASPRGAKLAFLAGYLDTDGSVRGVAFRQPFVEWYSVSRDLLVDVQAVLAAVGVNARLAPKRGTYKGEPHHSWRLTVADRAQTRDLASLPCRHAAKRRALRAWSRKIGSGSRRLAATVRLDPVASVEPAGEGVSIGLEVEGGTHVTGGLVTHNTTLFAALALYHLLTTENARCYVGAASRDQATLLYDHARGFVRRTDKLEQLVDVKAGYREIRSRHDTGFMQVKAADANTTDGVGPTLALVDELHRHKTNQLYAVFRDGLGPRDGQIVTISTAGDSLDTPLGQMREAALRLPDQKRDGFHVRAAATDGGYVLHEWSVPDGADTDDIRVVKRANPASFVTVEQLRQRRGSASMHERDWLRFACNRWVNFTDPWLQPGAWDACRVDGVAIPAGADVVLGVDIGLKQDRSAVVAAHAVPGEATVVEAHVFDPPPRGALDLSMVEAKVRELAGRYHLTAVAYDRWAFERSAQTLSDEGLPMVEFPMTNLRTVPASTRLYEAVMGRKVAHDGDPVLAAHVNAGVTRDTERGWRLAKGKATQPIDALMAMLMAHDLATAQDTTSIYEQRGLAQV